MPTRLQKVEDDDGISEISFCGCEAGSTTASNRGPCCEPAHGEHCKASKHWDEAVGRADMMAVNRTCTGQSRSQCVVAEVPPVHDASVMVAHGLEKKKVLDKDIRLRMLVLLPCSQAATPNAPTVVEVKMKEGSRRHRHNVKLLEQNLADGRQDSLRSFQLEFLDQFSPVILSGLRRVDPTEICCGSFQRARVFTNGSGCSLNRLCCLLWCGG